MTAFNGWLLGKLTSFLTSKEGFIIDTSHYTADGIRSEVRDAMGFRYEITIRGIGRIHNSEYVEKLFDEGTKEEKMINSENQD